MNIWRTTEERSKFGDGGHSAVLRTLPLSGSLNRWINDSLTLVQSLLRKPSFIRNTLADIAKKEL
jgi:hypothetical protein